MSKENQKIRTRFAPSPTGFVHIGNFRTALFSFLFARHNGGVHVLRVEDTDQNRQVEGSIENLLQVMGELGVEFDEGFYLNDGILKERGNFGPYLQSERLELYQKYALELVESQEAYYCFCDEQRLEDLRKEQIALKKPPMYDRHCRYLSKQEVQEKLTEFKASGKNPVIRQAIPEDGQTVVSDLVYGEMVFDHKILDDQVLLKSDGFPTYHLAVVVDDHTMEISHVIRGEEWISSTPKHILLYKALGWQPTLFAHLPLILNPDKSKLSKRQGDVSVENFLAKGYLKEALVNFVAFLGWNPKTEQEIFSLPDLVSQFDLAKVNKAPAIFDLNKLDWLNGLYIRQMNLENLTEQLLPYWKEAGVNAEKFAKEYLESIAALERERLKKLSEIGERTKYFFEAPKGENYKGILVGKNSNPKATEAGLDKLINCLQDFYDPDFTKEVLEKKVKDFIADNNLSNNDVLWPMRVALTGLSASPNPFEVASVLSLGLGKEEVLKRLKQALIQAQYLAK